MEYPPIGVEVKALELERVTTTDPGKNNCVNIWHRENALAPIVVHAGKLTVVNVEQLRNAYDPILVHTGKLMVVNLEQ